MRSGQDGRRAATRVAAAIGTALTGTALIGTAVIGTALIGAALISAAGPSAADPSVPSTAAGLAADPSTATATAPPVVAITISDGVKSAKARGTLSYQATVTNLTGSDVQLLFEMTLPNAAKVLDAGGGTMRANLIDYGVTVLGHGHVTEKFSISLGSLDPAVSQVKAVASAYVLGAASAGDGTAPTVQASDIDTFATAGHSAAAAGGAQVGPARSSSHRGLWIVALIFGILLIGVGLLLALWRGAGGRRRTSTARVTSADRVAPGPATITLGPVGLTSGAAAALPRRSRSARRASQAAADAGINPGAHQAPPRPSN